MSTEPQDDAEVIELATRRTDGVEPKLRVLPKPSCWPCAFDMDEKSRTVSCRRCGRAWQAFDALVYLARNWQRYAANRDAMRREVKQLEEKRERLRKDVQNLKAQARRRGGAA